MTNYNDTFRLSVSDIETIEEVVRREISRLSDVIHTGSEATADDLKNCSDKVNRLHKLLGKLHNQKIWYGQVHQTGMPLSG
jgi:hypothetical protein